MSPTSLKIIIKGSFWVVLAAVITRFAGFVALPILARLLGPAGLGLYNLVQNTVQTGDGLSRLGADAAMHRNGSQYQTIGSEVVGRLFGVGASLIISAGSVIAICLWLGREAISHNWLGESRVEPWLGLTAIIIVLTTVSNPPWLYLVALHDFRTYSLRTSVVSIIGAILTISLAWFFGLSGAIWGLGLTALIQAVWGWWLTLPVLKEKGIQLRCDKFLSETRDILSFGLPFYASNFLSSFVALPLLGYVSRTGGIEQLGYLRVAQSLSQFISFLPTAIAPVLISNLSASFAAHTTDYRKLKSLHLRSLWTVILILSVTICFSLEILITILYGSTYTEAILLSRLTIWITAVQGLSGMFTQYVLSSGKTRIIAVIQIIGLFITVTSALILIPLYSSIGLLIAQSLGAVLILLLYARPALADLEIADTKRLWYLAGLSFALVTATFFLPQFLNNIWVMLTALLLVAVTTTAGSLVIALTLEEKSLVRLATLKIIRKYLNY